MCLLNIIELDFKNFNLVVSVSQLTGIVHCNCYCCRKEKCKRIVTSQVMSETLEWLPSVGSWLHTGINWGGSPSTVKEGIFREETLHRQTVGHLGRQERHQAMGVSVFIRVGNFIGYWVGGVFQLFWRKGGISRDQAAAHSLTFMIGLETVIAPVGMSFSLLICYNGCILRLKA